MDGRIYTPHDKPHHVFDQSKGVHKYNRFFYLRMGVITEVDVDRYLLKVKWIHDDGARSQIPISFAYCGPAGTMGAIPEIGSIGIFGFYDEGGGKGAPLCLAFLPSGLSNGLDRNVVKINPDAIPTDDVNEIQHRFRRLRDGDMICTSPKGSTLFLNHNVELHDSASDIIMIRESDQAILATSLNNFMFADGAAVHAGPAIRNGLVLYNLDGTKIADISANTITGNDGRETIYMVPLGKSIAWDSQYYAEYRVDVDEYGDGKLDTNDINSTTLLSTRDPIVTMVLGNYIGAKRNDEQKYGRILRPMLFRSPGDHDGDFALIQASQNNGLDEPGILGLAYALHFHNAGTFFGVDKEGHYYMNLSASTANPMGAGRSMSILAQGNLKEIWGRDAFDGNSWDLTTKGGIKWDVGIHSDKNKGRSIDIITEGGIVVSAQGADDDGVSIQTVATGDVTESVGGNKSISAGDYRLLVKGLKTEVVQGSSSESCQNDRTINVSGVFTETAIKEKQCKFGVRKTTITSGNDELTVLRGDITEAIQTFGKRATTVTAGSIESSILTGDHKTMVGLGNYKVEVQAGSVEIKNNLGTVTIGIAGNVTVRGSLSVVVDAPIVQLGSRAPFGGAITGVPGIPSHFDNITGSPFKGSTVVGIA